MPAPVVYHPDYQAPLRVTRRFPMSKYGYLGQRLAARGAAFARPALANPPLLSLAHDAAYVDRVLTGALTAEEVRRIGLPQIPAVARRARLASAGTLLAARLALAEGVACNAAGGSHHADRAGGAGYCVFNDVAVAAAALLTDGTVGEIAVIDLDVHQGDGTARIFADEPRVVTLSVHGAKNYPAVKAASDIDVALPDGTGDAAYLAALDAALVRLDATARHEIAFYNAGVDPHERDRLGRLALSDAGLAARDRAVMNWAAARGVPLCGVLGGGYGDDPEVIAARHLMLFDAADGLHERL